MNVTVNGTARTVPEGTSLDALVELTRAPGRGTAVAVDGEVVPRGVWSSYQLCEGQAVELLTAVQGG